MHETTRRESLEQLFNALAQGDRQRSDMGTGWLKQRGTTLGIGRNESLGLPSCEKHDRGAHRLKDNRTDREKQCRGVLGWR